MSEWLGRAYEALEASGVASSGRPQSGAPDDAEEDDEEDSDADSSLDGSAADDDAPYLPFASAYWKQTAEQVALPPLPAAASRWCVPAACMFSRMSLWPCKSANSSSGEILSLS